MSRQTSLLTNELIYEICARVRAGAFDHVAAGTLGVPPATFRRWLRQGRRRGDGLQRRLVIGLHEARALARLTAEMNMRHEDPKCWLLHGPGKETPTVAGWSALARAAAQAGASEAASLGQPAFAGLTRLLLKLLAPYPEARAAVAAGLAELPATTEPPADPPTTVPRSE
jgi:hypothetical protein